MVRERRRVGRLRGANHPNHSTPIRPFLIDSGCPKGWRAVICAKFFHRVDVRL